MWVTDYLLGRRQTLAEPSQKQTFIINSVPTFPIGISLSPVLVNICLMNGWLIKSSIIAMSMDILGTSEKTHVLVKTLKAALINKISFDKTVSIFTYNKYNTKQIII